MATSTIARMSTKLHAGFSSPCGNVGDFADALPGYSVMRAAAFGWEAPYDERIVTRSTRPAPRVIRSWLRWQGFGHGIGKGPQSLQHDDDVPPAPAVFPAGVVARRACFSRRAFGSLRQ